MSKSEQTRPLLVTSEDSAVWITVLDRKFAPVAEGLGTIEKDLPLGLYEARFEAGSSVRGQLFSLTPGEDLHRVHENRIAFATPTPLPETRSDVPAQSNAAARISREVPRRIGEGGQLMVFVRDVDLRGRSNPMHGLTLRGDAEQLLVFEKDSVCDHDTKGAGPPWAGCNYELDPGLWRLRAPTPAGGSVEQTLVVCEGWQTQMFLQRGRSHVGRTRSLDLTNSSVLMAEIGMGFDPKRTELRSAELARQGLRDRRYAIAEKELDALLIGKPRNPMLGIYGVHLLIHRKQPDLKMIRRVADKLRDLVGGHPDVRAVELWLGDEACGDFAAPPMLKSSWSIVVQASAERPELVPRGSFSAMIAPRVLMGGPWLRWRTPRMREQLSTVSSPDVSLGEALAKVAETLPADPQVVSQQASVVSPAESSVISFAMQAGSDAAAISDTEVVRNLKVPRTVAEDAVNTILARFSGQ